MPLGRFISARFRRLGLGRRRASQASGVAGENDDGTNNDDVSSAGDSSNDSSGGDDDDESSVESLDEEDEPAFGHWDEEYYYKVHQIKDPSCTEFSLTEANMRSANRQGGPHLSVDACKSLGFYMRSADLSDLRISGLDLTTEAVQALFQTWVADSAVTKYGRSAIEVLVLGANPAIGSDHMITVSSLLRNNKNLRSLDLPRVGMSLEGVQNLAPVLTQQQLTSLNLSGNNLTDDAVRMLSEAVSKIKSLKILDLSSNCISAFSSVEPMFLDDVGRKQLNCPSLIDLSLKSNELSEDFLCKLGVALYGNTHVKSVDIEGNDLSERAGNNLYRALGGVGGTLRETFNANHCLTSFGDDESLQGYDEAGLLQRLLYINNLEVSPAEKARQKIKPLLCYARGRGLGQEVLDLDAKLMPYVLSIVAAPHPTIPSDTPKLGSGDGAFFSDHRSHIELVADQIMMKLHDSFRSDWVYQLVRRWNMPSLFGFYHPQPESTSKGLAESREELEKRKETLEEKWRQLEEEKRQELDVNDECPLDEQNRLLREKIRRREEEVDLHEEWFRVQDEITRILQEQIRLRSRHIS